MSATAEHGDHPLRLVVVNAGISDPSTTRMLAQRIAQKSVDALAGVSMAATVITIDLAPLAVDIARGTVAAS